MIWSGTKAAWECRSAQKHIQAADKSNRIVSLNHSDIRLTTLKRGLIGRH